MEVDLRKWTAESYALNQLDAPDHTPETQWVVSPDGKELSQPVNGQPSLFYSDFQAIGKKNRS